MALSTLAIATAVASGQIEPPPSPEAQAVERRQTIGVSLADMQSASLGVNGLDTTSAANANTAITALDSAIDSVTDSRLFMRMAALGVRAGMSREKAIYGLTMVFTNIITGKAAAVLMFPIAVAISTQLGIALMPFAIAVVIAPVTMPGPTPTAVWTRASPLVIGEPRSSMYRAA